MTDATDKPPAQPGDLNELQLDDGPQPDRLPPMLFLAALVHGILIIGITFNAVLDASRAESVSLEVTIVADPERSFDRDDQAAYLAQASQEGGGNTDDPARPGAPAKSSVPVDNVGDRDADDLQDATHHRESADQVLASRDDAARAVADKPRDDPQVEESRAAYLEAGLETTLPLPRDQDANFLVRDQNRQRVVIAADTRESGIAGYVDRWKRKIETVGSKYIPEQAGLRGLTGSPTIEVTIDASGRLADVIIVRSSGSRVLDEAALSILRRAAPFDPFPEAVRLDYPQLNFLYKWRFSDLAAAATAGAG
ncbi:MAG: TonB family protein [Woeseiaceae bacterium]|nr:TonB family protein [Woeseiaceae bacterium]